MPSSRFVEGWWLAEEVAVAFVYNGAPYAVMMATPADLEDFARGFTRAEGITVALEDLVIEESAEGITLAISIPPAAAEGLETRRRTLAGPTGCGLCGVELLGQAVRPLPRLPDSPPPALAAIARAFAALPDHQPENARNHSLHAAAWATPEGEIVLVREDVGRHNALDKLVGALGAPPAGFAVLSSRCSIELVQKAVAVGIPCLATLSAPTALAVRQAEAAGLHLATRGPQGSVRLFPARSPAVSV